MNYFDMAPDRRAQERRRLERLSAQLAGSIRACATSSRLNNLSAELRAVRGALGRLKFYEER